MARKISVYILTLICFLITKNTYALLSLELTRGVSGAIPIAVEFFSFHGNVPSQDIAAVIGDDLKNSGRFKVQNSTARSMDYYREQGVDSVIKGSVQSKGVGRYEVSFRLLDVFKGKAESEQNSTLIGRYTVNEDQLRVVAHRISDQVYQHILGVRGVFSTKLAYVVVQQPANGPARYILEVCDQDGYHPRPLLTSTDPIMSPAWSPNGRQVAYVSFENKHSAIYVQNLVTGSRRLISRFPGINGAPAWSPDGQKLALVLSKEKTPNIYIMNLTNDHLTQLTHDFYINTEPAWAPNGRSLIFTSNRSGSPQIYQVDLESDAVSRVTYDGNYNARASFTPDGNHIVTLNQQSNLFNIGILDLDTGSYRVLTHSGSDSESPSVAPNSSMVLYGTLYNGQSVLAMVATDGSVQMRLPARDGQVQDPAWSPFLN